MDASPDRPRPRPARGRPRGLLGLLIGSFLNVVVHRVPRGESVVRPPSACPALRAAVRPRDNVPVVVLAAAARPLPRLRDAHQPAATRSSRPATGLAFAAVAWRSSSRAGPVGRARLLYLAAISIALALIDLDVRRLPNAIVLPSYAVVARPARRGQRRRGGAGGRSSGRSLGAVGGFGFYFVLAFVYPAGMGFGDVKLAGVLGAVLAWAGWAELVVGGFLGFLLGGVVGILLMALRLATRKTMIPFGPYMILGRLAGAGLGRRPRLGVPGRRRPVLTSLVRTGEAHRREPPDRPHRIKDPLRRPDHCTGRPPRPQQSRTT